MWLPPSIDSRNLRGVINALPASRIGTAYLGRGGDIGEEWATGILAHWMRCNIGGCNFTPAFCERGISSVVTLHFRVVAESTRTRPQRSIYNFIFG
ncbi:hypothetical protein EVAR_38129_1 [Eumeta japonica]|uniref:Uncharacterized protein n=1 Tax=Eumeta variegata TaxID=151549 RepID=A0A4C1YLK3_EUMVA|nr:hypothetical protein EVAR_38129_1 [Eumeta japonica]